MKMSRDIYHYSAFTKEFLRILQKPRKTNKDAEYMMPYLKSLSCFHKSIVLKDDQLALLSQSISLHSLAANKDVFTIDSEGFCMYIILNGKVSVLVRANNDTMICVKYLESGDFFGELALVNKKPRAATIRTVTDCDFAVIYKKDYDAIIRKSQEDYISKITDFFRSIPLFKSWTKVALSKLQHNFELKSYKKGQVIFAEGEKAKNIFIIKEGEVEVTD